MRVAIDCYHALFPSGVRTYILGLLDGLAATGRLEELVLFANVLRPWRAPFPDVGPARNGMRVRARRLRLPRRAVERAWRWLGAPSLEMLVGRVDIFHGTHFVLPPARRARLVLSVHDVAYLRDRRHFYEKAINDYYHDIVLPEALGRADHILASSASTRRDLLEIFDLDPEKVSVVHLGAPPLPRPAPEAVEAVYRRFRVRRPAIVYPVGTITARKNLVRTLEAFRIVLDRGHDLRLVLTGIGPMPAEEGERIETLGLNSRTRHIFFRDRVELAALLAGAQVALYPSLYEGFGFPALEALACGAPLVASNVSSIPEVTGDAALLVDPRDPEAIAGAVLRVLEDPALRADLARRGRERAGRFTWGRCAAETLRVYEKVLSGR